MDARTISRFAKQANAALLIEGLKMQAAARDAARLDISVPEEAANLEEPDKKLEHVGPFCPFNYPKYSIIRAK